MQSLMPGAIHDSSSSKKHTLLDMIVDLCIGRDGPNQPFYIFDNAEVKRLSALIGFANHNDATHIDSGQSRSRKMQEEGFSIVHLGTLRHGRSSARHAFVRTTSIFHEFEDILESETYEINYRKSPLDEMNTSESNILSLAYNQGIVNRVLYPTELRANPSIYMAHRTRFTPTYHVGGLHLPFGEVQIEVDMTVEHEKHVTVFEAKNWKKNRSDFAIYQLFHPFHYYHKKILESGTDIHSVDCCYLVRRQLTGSHQSGSEIDVRRYTFTDPNDILSITCLSKQRFRLLTA
jgi:hypothetical protein